MFEACHWQHGMLKDCHNGIVFQSICVGGGGGKGLWFCHFLLTFYTWYLPSPLLFPSLYSFPEHWKILFFKHNVMCTYMVVEILRIMFFRIQLNCSGMEELMFFLKWALFAVILTLVNSFLGINVMINYGSYSSQHNFFPVNVIILIKLIDQYVTFYSGSCHLFLFCFLFNYD